MAVGWREGTALGALEWQSGGGGLLLGSRLERGEGGGVSHTETWVLGSFPLSILFSSIRSITLLMPSTSNAHLL